MGAGAHSDRLPGRFNSLSENSPSPLAGEGWGEGDEESQVYALPHSPPHPALASHLLPPGEKDLMVLG